MRDDRENIQVQLDTVTADLEALQSEHDAVRNKLEVTEVKNDKMLIKLKAFKEKNDKLQVQIQELQSTSSEQVSKNGIQVENIDVLSEENVSFCLFQQCFLSSELRNGGSK